MAGDVLETFSREQLAVLVREYLMAGHLIDRAGMPHVMAVLGADGFGPVAIEEWMGASPIYSKRMQRALGFDGDSVETIFKGMQFDIGAPPQFLDFRYRLHDRDHGEFWLDHCGALADVEPMGEAFVFTMCHDIEDPTFDATAAATNPRAQVRPIHRPPRVPADRSPVCHWTVSIEDDHEPVSFPAEAEHVARTRAATTELAPIDPADDGVSDYRGPLLADVRLEEWSRSALVRIAKEVCLQGHLLSLSFIAALRRRLPEEVVTDLTRHQFTGVAGVVATRLRDALGIDDVERLLAVHPAFLPTEYSGTTVDGASITISGDSGSRADDGWLSLLSPEHLEPLDAIVQAIDPRHRCAASYERDALVVTVALDDHAASTAADVELTRISTGAAWAFEDRGAPVEVRYSTR